MPIWRKSFGGRGRNDDITRNTQRKWQFGTEGEEIVVVRVTDGVREILGVASLVRVGDSLDVLGDPACGIDSPDALFEELCVQSSTFCD